MAVFLQREKITQEGGYHEQKEKVEKEMLLHLLPSVDIRDHDHIGHHSCSHFNTQKAFTNKRFNSESYSDNSPNQSGVAHCFWLSTNAYRDRYNCTAGFEILTVKLRYAFYSMELCRSKGTAKRYCTK